MCNFQAFKAISLKHNAFWHKATLEQNLHFYQFMQQFAKRNWLQNIIINRNFP